MGGSGFLPLNLGGLMTNRGGDTMYFQDEFTNGSQLLPGSVEMLGFGTQLPQTLIKGTREIPIPSRELAEPITKASL